jgi:hypothetical protein
MADVKIEDQIKLLATNIEVINRRLATLPGDESVVAHLLEKQSFDLKRSVSSLDEYLKKQDELNKSISARLQVIEKNISAGISRGAAPVDDKYIRAEMASIKDILQRMLKVYREMVDLGLRRASAEDVLNFK